MRQIALDIGLAGTPSLANFRPGPNESAWRHLMHLPDGGEAVQAIPTYLWGPSGSGKTHLLRALFEAWREQGGQAGWLDPTVVHPPAFDERWSAVLLDDVHRYPAHLQQTAFNWFVNACAPATGGARTVVATGDAPPSALQLREDLRTRLGWGLVFQLQPLSEVECRAVLRQAADERGVFLGDEVMDYMLRHFSRDLGSLMALLDELDRYALQTQRAITIPLLRAMLEQG